MAYRIQHGGKSIAVAATDLGHYDQYTIDHLLDLDAVLLESNHDLHMLETGPYPYYLKRRIMGDYGHLSNENAGRLLNCILNDKLKHILLGHLSKEQPSRAGLRDRKGGSGHGRVPVPGLRFPHCRGKAG